MNEQKAFIPSGQDIRIGLGIALCLLLCHFIPGIQTLAACTSVIMCAQNDGKASGKAALTRLLGVICGGVMGVLVALLHGIFPNPLLFALFAGIGILLNLLLCRLVKMPYIAARVSSMSFVLVMLLGGAPYAVNRFIGTLCGGIVAVAIAAIWAFFAKTSVAETKS